MVEVLANSLNSPTTTLNGSVTSGSSSLTVFAPSAPDAWPTTGTFRVKVDLELITVTAASSAATSLAVVGRGVEGTAAAAHSSGAAVSLVLTAAAVASQIPSVPVASVFARTGAVVAATNDYTDAQVQNSPTNKLTTTGDILYASAANTLARLGVGSALQLLGVAAGVPAWTTPALVQIASQTLVGAAATIDFASISPSYNHLLLVVQGAFSDAIGFENVAIRFNADSNAHYSNEVILGQGGAAGAGQTLNTSSGNVATWTGTTKPANAAWPLEILIPFYTGTTFLKNYLSRSYAYNNTNTDVRQFGGQWASTAAINEITLISTGSGNFIAGSQAILYGMT